MKKFINQDYMALITTKKKTKQKQEKTKISKKFNLL